jgi:hypothetical protein
VPPKLLKLRRKKRSKVWSFLLIPFCAVVWIVGVWSLERGGGTICVSNLTYISRSDIFLEYSDHVLQAKNDFDIYNIPPLKRRDANRFYLENSERFELVRLMSIRRPDQYWRAFFFPFSRQIDMRSRAYDDPDYNKVVDALANKASSAPVTACDIDGRLRNKIIGR